MFTEYNIMYDLNGTFAICLTQMSLPSYPTCSSYVSSPLYTHLPALVKGPLGHTISLIYITNLIC